MSGNRERWIFRGFCVIFLTVQKKEKKKKKAVTRNINEKKKQGKHQERVQQGLIPTKMTWYLQGVDYCLQSYPPPLPNASDSVSHLFSATAISHGLDTRVLLQRNPYNRLTVIKETSLQSNKISNFQLTRDAFQLAVLFSSFLSSVFFWSLLPFYLLRLLFHLTSNAFLIPQAL